MCTIFEIRWLRIRATLNHGKLDLFKILAFDACTLLKAFPGFRKLLILRVVSKVCQQVGGRSVSTHTSDREFEGDSMRFVWFALEMEGLDKMARINIYVFFGNALSNKSDILGDAGNAVFRVHFLVDLIVVDPVDSNGARSLLVV